MLKIDPVCGMETEFDADTKKNVPRSSFGGVEYVFCSQDCKDEFDESPEEYVADVDREDEDADG